MYQLKDKDCQSGSNNMTQLHVVYKKSTSYINTYRLKVHGWRKIYYANTNQKKDLEVRKMTGDKKFNI